MLLVSGHCYVRHKMYGSPLYLLIAEVIILRTRGFLTADNEKRDRENLEEKGREHESQVKPIFTV